MINIYVVKSFWEDDGGYCGADLVLEPNEALKKKNKLFKQGAAEIRIESWVYLEKEHNIYRGEDLFWGENPYSCEEIDDFSEEGFDEDSD